MCFKPGDLIRIDSKAMYYRPDELVSENFVPQEKTGLLISTDDIGKYANQRFCVVLAKGNIYSVSGICIEEI